MARSPRRAMRSLHDPGTVVRTARTASSRLVCHPPAEQVGVPAVPGGGGTVTSEGTYPPDPYPGSYGYPPDGDGGSLHEAGGSLHESGGSPHYGNPGSASWPPMDESSDPVGVPQPRSGSPRAARAAVSVPGLRAEPPSDGPMPDEPAPPPRSTPVTYGRPAQPSDGAPDASWPGSGPDAGYGSERGYE